MCIIYLLVGTRLPQLALACPSMPVEVVGLSNGRPHLWLLEAFLSQIFWFKRLQQLTGVLAMFNPCLGVEDAVLPKHGVSRMGVGWAGTERYAG